MKLISFREYSKIAHEAVSEPYPKQFQTQHENSEQVLKRHPGQFWRPIEWCDRCKSDITDGLFFDPESRAALCRKCAGVPSDEEAAATLGIIL